MMWEQTIEVQMRKKMFESGIFNKFDGCYGCPFSMQTKKMKSAALSCITPFSRVLLWVIESSLYTACIWSAYASPVFMPLTAKFLSMIWCNNLRLIFFLLLKVGDWWSEKLLWWWGGQEHGALWFSTLVMVIWLIIVAVVCVLVEKVSGFFFGKISSSEEKILFW